MPRRRRNAQDDEVVTIPCDFKGCVHQATHHPKVCVPAKGWPIDSHKPSGAVFGMKLCKEHARAFDAQALLLIKTNKEIFVDISLGNMQEPDFTRAFVIAVPIKPVASGSHA